MDNRRIITLDGVPVQSRASDAYIKVSSLARAGKKDIGDWMRLDDTKEYLLELSSHLNMPLELLVTSGKLLRYIPHFAPGCTRVQT